MSASLRLEEAALAQSLVDRMPGSGLLVVDSDLRIAVMNGGIYDALGYSDCVGRRVPDVIPATAWQVLGPRYRAALDGHVQSFDYEAASGASVLSTRIAPIRDGAEVIGVMVLSEDITTNTATIKRLTESEDRLRAAHAVARLASWEWRPETDEMEIFEALPGDEALTGTRVPLDTLLDQIPPGERRAAREDLAAVARGDRDDTVRLSLRGDGSGGPEWIETRSRAVRDDDGRVSCVRGTTQDVTEQELAKRDAAGARDFFQATLDSLSAHIAVIDDRGDIVMTNRAWDAFAAANDGTGASSSGNYLEACDGAEADELASQAAAGLRSIIAGEQRELSLEYPCHSPTAERWFVLRAARFDGSGNARVVVSHENVTERRQAEGQVATQAALLDEVDVAVVAAEPGGRITHWNRGAERLFGWTCAEAVGRHRAELVSRSGRAAIANLRGTRDQDTQLTVCRKDGSTFPASLHSRDMVDADGLPAGRITVAVDTSERVASERALLAGRNYMTAVADSIGEGLISLDTEGRVIYMNGAAGELLGWSSEALQGRVLHHVVHSHGPDGSELPLEDRPVIRVHSDGRTGVDDLFFCRDGRPLPVSYTASPFETGDGVEGCVVVFAEISERKAYEEDLQREAEKLSWIGRIQDALAEDRFVLYAQPIVDLGTHEVVQSELLLRMRSSDGTLVGPGSFLPVAEQYGLIGDIDRWVIEQGVSIAAGGRPVEINLSAHSIGDEAVFDHIQACVQGSGADPTQIIFEITETAIVEDEAAAQLFAERLQALGCKLALDDFGTGYGGFTYLKQLPIDFLKIDTQFVSDLATNPGSRHVVEAVVGLAKGFSLQTVAEGVEDAETYELLLELGVDFAQGYHIARPGPLASTDLDNIEPTGDATHES